MNQQDHVFAQLMATIEDRKANPPPNSYTAKLFEGGVKKVRVKLIEEAAELFEAAAEPGDTGRGTCSLRGRRFGVPSVRADGDAGHPAGGAGG